MAELRLAQGRAADSFRLYREALELQSSPEVHLEFASALIDNGRPREAGKEALEAAEADPANASAWAIRGGALRAAGDNRGAVEALSRSLEIRPDPNVAYALGTAFLALHEREKADGIFQQIIRGSGNAAIWHVAVGDAYRGASLFPEAIAEFKKAISVDPRAGHAEFFLGLTYLQMNQWGPSPESLEHLRAAVRLRPNEFFSNFYLGALESTGGSDLVSSDRHLHAAAAADPNSPEVWLYLGGNAGREKNVTAEKAYLRKAIELTGADEAQNNYQVRRAYFALGRILIAEGNRAEGEALLAKYSEAQKAALQNSVSSIAQTAQGDLASSAMGDAAKARASFPGMSSTFQAASSEDAEPRDAEVALKAKQTPEQARQSTASDQHLRELLASSLNDLGTAEARQGQYKVALGHFQMAEQWQPPSPTLLHNIGIAAFRVEDFKESARALGLYLESAGAGASGPAQDERSRMMLAMSQFTLGQFPEAAKSFDKIPALTAQDPRAAYSWAYSLAHSGQQQHANQIADNLSARQLPPEVMSLVCHLYMDTENYEHSVACFRKAYQADPGLKLAHYQVAESLIRLDRPAEAVTELRQEIALSPDNPDVQYSLAFALLQSSQKAEAMEILRKVTAAHPDHAQAQYQLGKALLEGGDPAEAVKHLELAEQNDPGPDYIHYQLQAAYRKSGRIQDADRELALYREIKSRNRDVTTPH